MGWTTDKKLRGVTQPPYRDSGSLTITPSLRQP